jgi:hypothetical protein
MSLYSSHLKKLLLLALIVTVIFANKDSRVTQDGASPRITDEQTKMQNNYQLIVSELLERTIRKSNILDQPPDTRED